MIALFFKNAMHRLNSDMDIFDIYAIMVISYADKGNSPMNTWIENYFDSTILGDLSLFYSGKREKSIAHQFGPYKQENYLLTYVAEGSAEFKLNGQSRHVEENTFYVMRPRCGMTYKTDPNKPWTIYWVIIGGNQLENLLDILGLTVDEPFVTIRESIKMRSAFTALFERTGRDGLADKMESLSLLYSIFSILAENRTRLSNNAYISKALDYISKNYAQEFSIQDLAAMLHLNYSYFSRLFKKETGLSPVRFITTFRVKKAEYLLKHSAFSITDTAKAVGFSDVLYFSRAFKRCTGISPSTYKELVEI